MALSAIELKNLLRKQPVRNSDDLRVIRSWAEYEKAKEAGKDDERPLKYLMFEMEVKEGDGAITHVFKAIKFVRVIRLPKSAKQSTSFMDMHSQVLSGIYEKGANLITIIANMIDPVPLGLLFLYGVQGVATDAEAAQEIADSDFLALRGSLQGTYRVLEARTTNAQEIEWLRQKMFAMNFLSVIRGIPKARETGVDMGNKGFGGQNLNPESQDTLEEFIAGMADREYVLQILSTPVKYDTLATWQRMTQEEMTRWHGQRQGSKSLSFNLSIPMMYSANLSNNQGWSHSYSDASSVGESVGESFSQSFGTSHGIGTSHTEGTTIGQSVGQTVTDSVSQSHSVSQGSSYSQSVGQSINQSVGQNQSMTQSFGINESTSESLNQSQGVSQNNSIGVSENLGQNFGVSQNFGQNMSTSLSHSQGGSYGINSSESINASHSVGMSQNTSLGKSINMSHGVNASISDNISRSDGVSYTENYNVGRNDGYNWGTTRGSSYGESTTPNHSTGNSISDAVSKAINGSAGAFGFSGGGSTTDSHSETLSKTTGLAEGASFSRTASANSGINHSFTQGAGFSNGETHSLARTRGISNGESFSISDGTTFSQGYGASEGWSQGQSFSRGQSWGENWSDGITNSVGSSVSEGYSQGISRSQGTSQSESVGQSQSISEGWGHNVGTSQSLGNSTGISQSSGVGKSFSESFGQTTSESFGISQGRSVGFSESQSRSQSVTDGTSENFGTNEGVSTGTNTGRSSSRSLGTSLGTTGGFAQGIGSSIGLGPSIGYSKTYQWLDQQVEDILELLTFQNERLKLSLRGCGAFFVDVYLSCPDNDAMSQATALAKSTWQNKEAKISPIQVLDLSPEEQAHLLYHFSAFSADVSVEGAPGMPTSYKYSTLLLPHEFAALSHLPRISEGGVFADVNDIPKFAVPSMKQGEIYMGKILSAERFTMKDGYVTPFDFRIDSEELMHGYFTGASRSGKTVAATRFIAELSRVRRKKTGKRLRIVCLDPKQDWRILARFVEPERFKFFSLGNIHFRPINLNLCKIPRNVWPQTWIDGLIEIYCRAYGLLERGKQILAETFYALYEEAGVFEACDHANWAELVPERSAKVTFPKVYQKMDEIRMAMEDPNNRRKAGNDTRDAYARVLDRLQVFKREYSVEVQLFGRSDGMGVDDLIGQDDVVVLESYGLSDPSFKNFVFGAITSGFFKYAQSNEGGFLAPNQYETVLVIEEANEVLTGNDTASSNGSNGPTLSGQSDFEKIFDQSAGLGLFLIIITQKIADMPSSVVANCGLVFAARLKRPDDVNVVIRSIAREERFEDRDLVKFIPRAPTGWLICQSSRVFEIKDMEPVLVQIAKLDASTPSNQELEALLTERQAAEMLAAAK